MRFKLGGRNSLRTIGVAGTVAGLGLLSFGTLHAGAAVKDGVNSNTGHFDLATTASADVSGDGWLLRDSISLTIDKGSTKSKHAPGGLQVSLFTQSCDTDEGHAEGTDKAKGQGNDKDDGSLVKSSLTYEVAANKDGNGWTATTQGVNVGKAGDYHFQVLWAGRTECENVKASAPAPTATPTPVPTPTPTAVPTPVPTPTAAALPTSTTTSSAAVSAASVVKTPSTGADLPFGLGGALFASGLGFLGLGARRRRSGK